MVKGGGNQPSEGDKVIPTLEAGVGSRIKSAIDRAGGYAAAAMITNKSVMQLRRYGAEQSEPPLGAMAALARAAGVSLDWLVAGEGPMRPEGREPAAPPLDEALLELAVRLLEEWLAERRLVLRPEPKAKAIAALYEIGLEAQAEGRGLEQRQVDRILRLVA